MKLCKYYEHKPFLFALCLDTRAKKRKLNISSLRVGIEPTTCHSYSHTLCGPSPRLAFYGLFTFISVKYIKHHQKLFK